MRTMLETYALRKFVNAVVDATEEGPSLAEMVARHLEVDWARMREAPFHALIAVHDTRERWLELRVVDARGYPDATYRKSRALLRIGVNGALATPEDEEEAKREFRTEVFRTCRRCGRRFGSWLDYYAHVKVDHLGQADPGHTRADPA